MNKEIKKFKPKERILRVAHKLFYTQGYISTGINQIIEEAYVSKASFYDHFKSKEELCVAYLQSNNTQWISYLKSKINEFDTPIDRFMAPLDLLGTVLLKGNFRGCPFLNITSEVVNIQSNIRKEVIYSKDGLKTIIRELTKDLKSSNIKYKQLDVKFTTNVYYILMEGVVTACQIYGEISFLEDAQKAMKKIICKGG